MSFNSWDIVNVNTRDFSFYSIMSVNKKETIIYISVSFYIPAAIGRINSSVLLRSSSVWQFVNISSRFSELIMNASLHPVSTPR